MKIDFTPDPSLYPFEQCWFTSYAGQMHYVDEGGTGRRPGQHGRRHRTRRTRQALTFTLSTSHD